MLLYDPGTCGSLGLQACSAAPSLNIISVLWTAFLESRGAEESRQAGK